MLWKPRKPALWRVFSFQDPLSGSSKIPHQQGYLRGTASLPLGDRTPMPRLATPLSDLQCRTAKPRERAYKLFDGGGMYLFVKPNGVKT